MNRDKRSYMLSQAKVADPGGLLGSDEPPTPNPTQSRLGQLEECFET